jgi:hypothetical protein
MFKSIPSIPFDREQLDEIIECIPNTDPGLQAQITALINNIKSSADIINKNTSLDVNKKNDIQNELKKMRENAEEFFTITKYLGNSSSLQNTVRSIIFKWIKPCESALSALEDEINNTFKQNIQSLYQQQQKTSQTTSALKNHLRSIKEYFHKPGTANIRCYIVHAKPTNENEATERDVKPFLLKLYEHLVEAGINVKMDLNDLKPGQSYNQFINDYSDGNAIILVGTKSLYDSHHSNGNTDIQSALPIIINQTNNRPELLYPLLINGTFKASYPEQFNKFESKLSPSQDYLDILKHLIGMLYKNRMIADNKVNYDNIWSEFYKNPILSENDGIFEAIKMHDSKTLMDLVTIHNLNIKHDLSASEIDYLNTRLKVKNGKLMDYNLTKGLTPLFMAILYQNRDAYGYFMSRGANPRAKTASSTNLYAFMKVFGEREDYLILEDRYPELTFDRNIPITFEETKRAPMPTTATPAYPGVFFQSSIDYMLLSTYIPCCKRGDIESVRACIRQQTHKRDKNGEGLYEALKAGHEACVGEIMAAGAVADYRHYFAAGLISADNKAKTIQIATNLYYAIKPKEESANNKQKKAAVQYPQVILEGNVSEIKTLFESSVHDHETKSIYLYKLLSSGHLHAVRYVLTTLTSPVAPRHYFAAALSNDSKKTKLFYELLTFYTYEASQPSFESSSPYDVLGVKSKSEDIPYSVVKQAYKDLALRYHSDKDPTLSNTLMQKINQAKDKIIAKEDDVMRKISGLFSDAENNQYESLTSNQDRSSSRTFDMKK